MWMSPEANGAVEHGVGISKLCVATSKKTPPFALSVTQISKGKVQPVVFNQNVTLQLKSKQVAQQSLKNSRSMKT